MSEVTRTLPVSCNLDCGGGCPLLATVTNGRVTSITDNPAGGPYLTGCVRGYNAHRVLYSPDRLRKPLLRAGPRGSGQFREISWCEALDRVAEGLIGMQQRYGNEAVIALGGSGSCRGALHNTGKLLPRFLSLYGGYTSRYGSYSSGAATFAIPYVLGDAPRGIDPATLRHSRMIVLWGLNAVDCRFGCELLGRLREAKKAGTEILVIDPRRSRTARQLGSRWIPIYPGTDAALMLAILHVWISEGLLDRAFVDAYSIGFPDLQDYVLGIGSSHTLNYSGVPSAAKTPAWAESVCGVPADVIIGLARQYACTKPVALLPGLSLQRTLGGEEAVRLAIALQVISGNLGRMGGSSGAYAWGGLPAPRVGSLPLPVNPSNATIPVYRWPDAILEGRLGGFPSDVHAIYNVGGNYISQGADVHKSIRAFEKVEFSVCHDHFLTPTARYCDLVLPTTTWLEREDIVFPNANFVLYSHRAVPPLSEVRNDYDIFGALADRLGFGDAFSEGKDEDAWLRTFLAASEITDVSTFRATGIYWGRDQERVGLADFVADPQAHPLNTPSGKVELASAAYARTGYPAVPTARIVGPDEQYPLRLITPKSRYRIHSQHSNLPWFRQREEQALWMHPRDALPRGVADGQHVLVTSAQGRVCIPAHVTEDIMPGVVCLMEGVWPDLGVDGTDVAGAANVLTCTEPTQPSSSSRTHSVNVQVTSKPK